MQNRPSQSVEAMPDDNDYYPFDSQLLPNAAKLGVVTLGPDGEFLSSRPLTQAELAEAWSAHHARQASSLIEHVTGRC